MKRTKKKPTNKEMLDEIQFLGSKLFEVFNQVKNIASVVDLYILYKKDEKKFEKFVQEKLIEVKDKPKEEPAPGSVDNPEVKQKI